MKLYLHLNLHLTACNLKCEIHWQRTTELQYVVINENVFNVERNSSANKELVDNGCSPFPHEI